MGAFIPLGIGLGAYYMKKLAPPEPGVPALPGPTDAEVLASDLRLRRRVARESGGRSTLLTGGLANKPATLTMPSLIGI